MRELYSTMRFRVNEVLQSLLIISLFLLSYPALPAHAKVVQASLQTSDSWYYIDKFSFQTSPTQPSSGNYGYIYMEITFHSDSKTSILLYFWSNSVSRGTDQKQAWSNVVQGHLSCSQKMLLATAGTHPVYSYYVWDEYFNALMNGCIALIEAGQPMTAFCLSKRNAAVDIIGDEQILANLERDLWSTYYILQALISSDANCTNTDGSITSACQDAIASQASPDNPILYEEVSLDGEWITIKKKIFVTVTSPTYLFSAVSNCDPKCISDEIEDSRSPSSFICQGALDVQYKFEFANGETYWNSHFGVDERGLLELNLICLTLYSALVYIGTLVRHALKLKFMYHPTVSMLLISITLQWFSILCGVIHFLVYAQNGIGLEILNETSKLLCFFSEVILIVQIIVIAKGWTICVRKLSASARIKIGIYTAVYTMGGIFLHLWWWVYGLNDPVVFHLYDSIPGYVIAALRVYAIFWFLYSRSVTREKYPVKENFYRKFSVGVIIWLSYFPGAVLLSLVINIEFRYLIIQICTLLANAIIHTTLLVMYNPDLEINQSFPFYATVSEMEGSTKSKFGIFSRDSQGVGGGPGNATVSNGDSHDNFLTVGKLDAALFRQIVNIGISVKDHAIALTESLFELQENLENDDDSEAVQSNKSLDLSETGHSSSPSLQDGSHKHGGHGNHLRGWDNVRRSVPNIGRQSRTRNIAEIVRQANSARDASVQR